MSDNEESTELLPRFIGNDPLLFRAKKNSEWNMSTWSQARWNQWGVYKRPGTDLPGPRYFYFDLEERTLLQFNQQTNDIVVCWEQGSLPDLIWGYLYDVLPDKFKESPPSQGQSHGVAEIPPRWPGYGFSETTIALPTPLEWIDKFVSLNEDFGPIPVTRYVPNERPWHDNRILRMDLDKCELSIMTKPGPSHSRLPPEMSAQLYGEYTPVWNQQEHYRDILGYFVDHLAHGLDEVDPLLPPKEWLMSLEAESHRSQGPAKKKKQGKK